MKTLNKIITAGLIISGLAGMASCTKTAEQDQHKVITERKVLHVGDIKSTVIYNGMPNDKTFSISYCNNTAVYTFYPTSIKKFRFGWWNYDLVSVCPESLVVDYTK